MNKKELAEEIAKKAGVSTDIGMKCLRAFTETVMEQLKKGEHVQIVGFGSFQMVDRAAKFIRIPKTGERKMIEAGRMPKFKPGKILKEKTR